MQHSEIDHNDHRVAILTINKNIYEDSISLHRKTMCTLLLMSIAMRESFPAERLKDSKLSHNVNGK